MYAKRYLMLILSVAYALAVLPLRRAAADVAVVIGINDYPKTQDNLDGCLNDADLMAQALKKHGFDVIRLQNEQASKAHILATLDQIRQRIKPTERFTLYFAGHGTHDDAGNCYLLPSDADDYRISSLISKEELKSRLNAIQARSITLLLDSCFSGGMRALIGGKSRYHRIGQTGQRLHNLERSDTNDNIVPNLVAGFTAGTRLQPVGERLFGSNNPHGIFTYYLAERLNQRREESWDDLVTAVAGKVAAETQQRQTPVFGPDALLGQLVFAGKETPPPPPADHSTRTLWDDYVQNRANPDYVQVALIPNRSVYKRGTEFNIRVKIGKADGYLVMLNADDSDKIYLIYPDPGDKGGLEARLQSARVTAGMPAVIIHARAADIGTERVKAILFRTREEAEGLLSRFPADGATINELQHLPRPRPRHLINLGDWSYFTSMLQVDVVEQDE